MTAFNIKLNISFRLESFLWFRRLGAWSLPHVACLCHEWKSIFSRVERGLISLELHRNALFNSHLRRGALWLYLTAHRVCQRSPDELQAFNENAECWGCGDALRMACSAFTSPHNLICRERRVETNAANENYSLDFHRNPKADARWMNREEFPFSSGVIGHQIASKPLEQWSIGQLHVERQSLSKVVASLWMAIRAAVEGRCKWSRREKVFRMVTWAATGSTWFFDLFFSFSSLSLSTHYLAF
jgi:hypothetical protein